jgi:hypothetical protein
VWAEAAAGALWAEAVFGKREKRKKRQRRKTTPWMKTSWKR